MKHAFSDGPVLEPGPDDWLKRESFAKGVARLLSTAGKDRSVVFALYGRFGEGKTTVLNFVECSLKHDRLDSNEAISSRSPVLIRFEPWIFSNSENLIRAFFSEVSSQLPGQFPAEQREQAETAAKRLKKLGTTLEWAGKSFQAIEPLTMMLGFPGFAQLLGKAMETSGSVSQAGADAQSPVESPSVADERTAFQKALAELETPIIVVLDDFDRLTPDEVLLMMQLVKATTNFNGLHYLIVADRANLEKHLKAKRLSRDYLEKIVQYDLTLPSVDSEMFRVKLRESFQGILRGTKNGSDAWLTRWDIQYNDYGPTFFTTIRSVKRFMATFDFYVDAFREGGYSEVDLADLWAVELLRVFAPECHRLLSESRGEIFRDRITDLFNHEKVSIEKRIEHISAKAPEDIRLAVSSLLISLFGPDPADFASDVQDEIGGREELRLRSKLFFPAYFRLELPEAIVRERELGEWAQIAETGSSDKLRLRIESENRTLSLSSIIRAVRIRWKVFTQNQKLHFVEALSAIEGSDLETAKASSNAVGLVWMFIEEIESSTKRESILTSLAKCSDRWPAILSFLDYDQREAWKKDAPLLKRQQRAKLFYQLAQGIQSLAKTDTELKLPARIVVWVWSRYANPQALKAWIMSRCSNKKDALLFLDEIGNRHATSIEWNGKHREVKLLIGRTVAALLPVSYRRLKQCFKKYAKGSVSSKERVLLEDAAWCMDRAAEDASLRKRIYAQSPKLNQHYIWLPEDMSAAGDPLVIVPVDEPEKWISKVKALASSGEKALKCEVSSRLMGKRSGALIIIVPNSHHKTDEAKAVLQQLGLRSAWFLRENLLGVMDAESGDLAWTGTASDRVFYAGSERTRTVSSSE